MTDQIERGSFRTDWPDAPDTFALGCVTVGRLRSIPGSLDYSIGDDGDLAFWIVPDASASDPGSMFWVLVAAKDRSHGPMSAFEDFADVLAMYRSEAKAFRLAGNRPFHAELLAVPAPEGWSHDAFRARPRSGSGRTIVHSYESDDAKVLIRYMRPDADIADHLPFHAINRGLRIVSGHWTVHERALDVRPPGAERLEATPLSPPVHEEIADSIARARRRLDLPGDATGAEAVLAILPFIDRWITARPATRRDRVNDVAIELGCLWGQALCDALGWSWCQVGEEESGLIAVASQDRGVFVAPMLFMQQQLRQRGQSADNTTRLLFNMLCAGKIGPTRPGELRQLG